MKIAPLVAKQIKIGTISRETHTRCQRRCGKGGGREKAKRKITFSCKQLAGMLLEDSSK
jgi:hypothetical protein